MAWAMHEVEDELSDIKREIIESRGLVIRTNNLTNALSADIQVHFQVTAGLRAPHRLEQCHGLRRVRRRGLRGIQGGHRCSRRRDRCDEQAPARGERSSAPGPRRAPAARGEPSGDGDRSGENITTSFGRASAPTSCGRGTRSSPSRYPRPKPRSLPTRWPRRGRTRPQPSTCRASRTRISSDGKRQPLRSRSRSATTTRPRHRRRPSSSSPMHTASSTSRRKRSPCSPR